MSHQVKPAAESFSLDEYLKSRRAEIDTALEQLLPADDACEPRLNEAMRHSLLAGGKRLRPVLAIAACEALGGSAEEVLAPAIAIEFVHTYSLIHDDLPAMDDASLRRGLPTCHKAFDEATAILAGDGLLTEAFGLIADWGMERHKGEIAARLVWELARAAGVKGMVSGQALDLKENGPENIEALDRLHELKTGAMIMASIRIGAIVAGADHKQLEELTDYARKLGLAFQIVDDLLDDSGENTGKDTGIDAQRGKRTYPAFAGREGSRGRALDLINSAIDDLSSFDMEADPLRAIAYYVIERTN